MSDLLARADPPDPVELLESAGWRCSEHTVPELCSTYGRSLSLTDSVTEAAPPRRPVRPDRGRRVPARPPVARRLRHRLAAVSGRHQR